MKLEWKYDSTSYPRIPRDRQDIDLYDGEHHVGWVVTVTPNLAASQPSGFRDVAGYYVSFGWEDKHLPEEAITYATRYQAMRALRRSYLMFRLGGGRIAYQL